MNTDSSQFGPRLIDAIQETARFLLEYGGLIVPFIVIAFVALMIGTAAPGFGPAEVDLGLGPLGYAIVWPVNYWLQVVVSVAVASLVGQRAYGYPVSLGFAAAVLRHRMLIIVQISLLLALPSLMMSLIWDTQEPETAIAANALIAVALVMTLVFLSLIDPVIAMEERGLAGTLMRTLRFSWQVIWIVTVMTVLQMLLISWAASLIGPPEPETAAEITARPLGVIAAINALVAVMAVVNAAFLAVLYVRVRQDLDPLDAPTAVQRVVDDFE